MLNLLYSLRSSLGSLALFPVQVPPKPSIAVSMTHAWYCATDGKGASVRVILFDFKKAFDLIDHRILVRKLGTYNIPDAVISWITDFLTSRKQRVKLGHDCFSEWGAVPAEVPQGTKLGLWLFIIMINELDVPWHRSLEVC